MIEWQEYISKYIFYFYSDAYPVFIGTAYHVARSLITAPFYSANLQYSVIVILGLVYCNSYSESNTPIKLD